jgi:diguanylate cyclase (GGDEF)-like protein
MRGYRAVAPATGAVLLGGFVTVMLVRPGGPSVVDVVDDVGTCVAGLLAAAALGVRAQRSAGIARRSWAMLAAGALFASLGDLLWAYYELVQGRETPFPSLADASYLLFPVFTGLGLLTHPQNPRSRQATLRLVSDGVLVASSLFALSWATALGVVAGAGADSSVGFAVALAYPVTDVILLTIIVLVITRSSLAGQTSLILTGAALACMTLADSAFAYLSSTGSYGTGNVLDSGFVAAYLLLAVAACIGTAAPAGPTEPSSPPPLWAMTVPYVLCAAGVATSVGPLVHRVDTVPLATAGILIASLVSRQLLTILDNRRLLAAVAQREQQLHHQAFHDDLTGLANRALFTDRLAHALTLPRAAGADAMAVLFLDLDDFKVINDSLGHHVGDGLLVRVAERLRAAVRECDTVARLGGDEFAVLLEASTCPQEIAGRIVASFGQPFVMGTHTLPVRASFGLATVASTDARPTAADLLKRADIAMYAAKHAGNGQLRVFTPDLAEVTDDEFDLRDALTTAIRQGTLHVAYQPIFETRTRRLLGVEALIRWHLDGTTISPDVFLPVARRLGLITNVDHLLLHDALAQLAQWRRMPGCSTLTCAVNTNEELLDNPDMVTLYTQALADHGLPPDALVVELPESHLNDSPDLAATVAQLRATGIKVALDDFGTHGSSLSRLHRVPVDTVKLDRDFLTTSPGAALDPDWLGSIIDLAHSLDMRVIAEGVETPDQLTTLATLGCDAVQGFLLGKPVPAEQIPLPQPVSRPLPHHVS